MKTHDDAYRELLLAMAQHYAVNSEHRRALAREAYRYAVHIFGIDGARHELERVIQALAAGSVPPPVP